MNHNTQTRTLTIFAPAKVNLYLHVTGRLDNGYHTLDSLISFADIGDVVEIEPSQDFQFEIDGPFASQFGPKERDSSPHSSNLVVRAAWALAQVAQKAPNVRARLTKNLPLGAGLGGGSGDAAALIWGLMDLWGISRQAHYLPGLMARLGADVPVCLPCRSARVRGIGDVLDPVPDIPEIPIVLVHPGKFCPTPDVFTLFAGTFKEPQSFPPAFAGFDDFTAFLEQRANDLLSPACEIVPEIPNVLHALEAQSGCALARMSGSGSACFGLFEDEGDAHKAVQAITEENPDWWAKAGWLARPHRY
ncbi:MAG: 4-(cytidine 5'-diphospho)-2-C-methyl-D-erythritol kinase [Alphaproteobacteria bacterium]|nr:4-(cytidine 5'-diphospho)-2-C-methyl-D-erythritol kinase [Alphaproteobacteria bacterium]